MAKNSAFNQFLLTALFCAVSIILSAQQQTYSYAEVSSFKGYQRSDSTIQTIERIRIDSTTAASLSDCLQLSNWCVPGETIGEACEFMISQSDCYYPHNRINFYDSKSVLVDWLEVCFECRTHQGPYHKEELVNLQIDTLQHWLYEQGVRYFGDDIYTYQRFEGWHHGELLSIEPNTLDNYEYVPTGQILERLDGKVIKRQSLTLKDIQTGGATLRKKEVRELPDESSHEPTFVLLIFNEENQLLRHITIDPANETTLGEPGPFFTEYWKSDAFIMWAQQLK